MTKITGSKDTFAPGLPKEGRRAATIKFRFGSSLEQYRAVQSYSQKTNRWWVPGWIVGYRLQELAT